MYFKKLHLKGDYNRIDNHKTIGDTYYFLYFED